MEAQLEDIYTFLKANRKYNTVIQKSFYKSILLPYNNTYDKVYALLYNVLNLQSQLNMNKAALFFKSIAAKKSNLNSFRSLLNTLGASKNTPQTYKALFDLLTKQPSWGDKTAALFMKAVYNTHIGYAKELKFWEDAPESLSKEDEIFLPVDAVIIFIFQALNIKGCKTNFNGINKYIKSNMPLSSFEIWDDLWYWGYITQKVEDKNRVIIFNEEKYWNLLHSIKDKNALIKVRELANQFIASLKTNKSNGTNHKNN